MTTFITTEFAGQTGVTPRLVRLATTDSFTTITTAGYLNQFTSQGYNFYPNDMALISYGTNSATSGFFEVSISGGDITLLPLPGTLSPPLQGNDYIPVVTTAGTLTVFSPTGLYIALGNIHAGTSGTAGNIACYAATESTGLFGMQCTANAGDYNIRMTNASHGQATTYTINDVGQASGWLMNCTHSTDPGSNLISFDVTITAAALALGGTVTLVPSSGTKRYKIRYLYMNAGGTNFSGGGGNRLCAVSDGTTNYAFVTAAGLQTLVNSPWGKSGDSDFQSSPTTASNTSTVAGANIVAKYSGGTTDYTTGSFVLSGIVERVA